MLEEIVLKQLNNLGNTSTLWVAYSGGLDSTVLLHLLAKQRPDSDIKAIHVHHGLHPKADQWQTHCEKICREWNVPLHIYNVNAQPTAGESPEAAARDARYRVFKQLVHANDCLLTAHHQADQAETVLLQLLRGAGIAGLAAMPVCTAFAAGKLLRPLLGASKEELLNYAHANQLEWVHDESNDSLDFDRNYIRHEIIPVLQHRWPGVNRVFSRTAQHCADAIVLLEELANTDLVLLKQEFPHILSIVKLLQLSASRQRNVIRYWLKSLQLPLPNAQHLEQIRSTILLASKEANPVVSWSSVEVRRYRDKLYALPKFNLISFKEFAWDCFQPVQFSGGILHCHFQIGQGIKADLLEKPVNVCFRKGGERIQPQGRQGSHPLKKCFQEWGVPPWERGRIPLIFQNGQLIAVVGYCVNAQFAAKENEQGGIITVK